MFFLSKYFSFKVYLGSEGSERHVLPFLDVASRPVVHEDHAEYVLVCLARTDRLAESIASAADKKGHL